MLARRLQANLQCFRFRGLASVKYSVGRQFNAILCTVAVVDGTDAGGASGANRLPTFRGAAGRHGHAEHNPRTGESTASLQPDDRELRASEFGVIEPAAGQFGADQFGVDQSRGNKPGINKSHADEPGPDEHWADESIIKEFGQHAFAEPEFPPAIGVQAKLESGRNARQRHGVHDTASRPVKSAGGQ